MHAMPRGAGLGGKWSPFVVMAIGFLVAYMAYTSAPERPAASRRTSPVLYRLPLNKWYFDELYDFLSSCARLLARPLPLEARRRGIIDGFGPTASPRASSTSPARDAQAAVRLSLHYALAMLIGVAACGHLVLVNRGGTADVRLSHSFAHHLPAAGRRAAAMFAAGDAEAAATRAGSRCGRRWSSSAVAAGWGVSTRLRGLPVRRGGMDRLRPIATSMGVDGISLPSSLLTTFLMPICILASWDSIEKRVKEYMIAFLCWNADDRRVLRARPVLFYVFFEGGLIPMFLIIGIWGGKRRIYAASSSSSTRCSARC
jgi:hypothetical protein